MLVQQIAGGTVQWEQLPVYLAAEFLAGLLAGLAYVALTKGTDAADVAADAAADVAAKS
jgi:glycerol uptake facilitator protein